MSQPVIGYGVVLDDYVLRLCWGINPDPAVEAAKELATEHQRPVTVVQLVETHLIRPTYAVVVR